MEGSLRAKNQLDPSNRFDAIPHVTDTQTTPLHGESQSPYPDLFEAFPLHKNIYLPINLLPLAF